MSERNARDTFLHYVADNLTGRTVHALRVDSNDPESGVFAMNAVNVRFLNSDLAVDLSTLHAVIDVVYDDENTAVDVVAELWGILSAAFYCPLLDYTNPAAPVPVGSHLLWDRSGVKFRYVYADHYCHETCFLKLRY